MYQLKYIYFIVSRFFQNNVWPHRSINFSLWQIALVDVLTAVGITPDGIVGHSVGELACAYADGTLTAEQTIIVAYWRGRSLLDLNLPPGAMAAVGMS